MGRHIFHLLVGMTFANCRDLNKSCSLTHYFHQKKNPNST